MPDKGFMVSTVRDAIAFLERAAHLEELRTTHGGLTAAQSGESVEAIRNYNAAALAINAENPLNLSSGSAIASVVGERSWTESDMTHEAAKLRRLLTSLERQEDARTLLADPSVRAVMQTLETGSGNASGRAKDEIRDFWNSGETFHEFDIVQGFANLEKRAIADFSDSSSLFTTDFSTRVAMYLRTLSPWMALATIINADNGRPVNVPELTVDPTTVVPGEGTAISESTPTLSYVAVTPKAYKTLSYVSEEALEDVEYNLTDYIARSAARSISLSFGSDATTTVLSGIANGGTATGAGGGGGSSGTALSSFFGWEDLIDLKYGRQAPYRDSGAWVLANGAIKKARKFKDGQGNYLWGEDEAVSAGQPDRLEGGNVYEDPYLAAPASATKSVLYGDFKSALVIKMMPIRVAASHEFHFSQDQAAFKSVLRAGIGVQDSTAAAYLVSANS